MAEPRTFLRDKEAEQGALRDALKSTAEGGANVGIPTTTKDVANLEEPTRRLIEEQVNSRVYGRARPDFTEPAQQGQTMPAEDQAPAPTPQGRPVVPQPTTEEQGLMARVESIFNEQPAMTRDELAAAEMARIQDQIDAINQLYDVRLAKEERAGTGRLGGTRALNALSGTLYDPFGQARMEETETYNRENINEITAQRAQILGQMTNEAQLRAQNQFNEDRSSALQRANAYVDSITNAYQLNQQEAQALRQEALRRAELVGQVDGQDTLDYRRFLIDSVNALEDNARADEQLELQRMQYERAGYQTQVMPDGNLIAYDMNKFPPEPVVIGNYARPRVSSGGGSGSGDPAMDRLQRDAFARFVQAGGDPRNIDQRDLANITMAYTGLTGGMSTAQNPFPIQRSFLADDQGGGEEDLLDSYGG